MSKDPVSDARAYKRTWGGACSPGTRLAQKEMPWRIDVAAQPSSPPNGSALEPDSHQRHRMRSFEPDRDTLQRSLDEYSGSQRRTTSRTPRPEPTRVTAYASKRRARHRQGQPRICVVGSRDNRVVGLGKKVPWRSVNPDLLRKRGGCARTSSGTRGRGTMLTRPPGGHRVARDPSCRSHGLSRCWTARPFVSGYCRRNAVSCW